MHSPKEEHEEAVYKILIYIYMKSSPGKDYFSEKVKIEALKA